jgi:N4-gp56 family major capsid protein
MAVYESGLLTASGLPAGQRAFYEQALLETLRTKSILLPFTVMKEDFKARDTGTIVYTEVMDTEPNWNALSESTVFLKGAHLDSRTVSINLEVHGDVIKVSDYNELTNYWNKGDLRGLVNGKLGQNLTDTMDILARNAFLEAPYKIYAGAGNKARVELAAGDLFVPDLAEIVRTHLEEREVPGVASPDDNGSKSIVCVTTPRVIHDIRTGAGSNWLDVQQYAGAARKFTSEAGSWAGVRFVRTNRLRMQNYGVVTTQTTLDGATVAGQGAAAVVDNVYGVGQANSIRYITTAAIAGFAVGQNVTIHSVAVGGAGLAPIEGDGTQETRRIVSIDVGNKRMTFDRPLLKDHATGDYVTNGLDVHASIFMGGPGVVFGVGERATPLVLPVIDDLGMIRRFAWRSFSKMQLFRPEVFEVVESAGSLT